MLGVKHLFICINGTLPLHISIRALELDGEIVTTTFSFVATVNSIIWEGCTPVFADILKDSPNIDFGKIERLITSKTQAILATHFYGYPCHMDALQQIADKHGLRVIYDGAHAIGCTYQGRPLLQYGDVSTCSLHAIKVSQMGGGGCVSTNDDEVAARL
jgi:dTDP-4-amino-4,6-dideoxygalactose transaminase